MLNLKAEVESSYQSLVAIARSRRFQLSFDRVNLHRPTVPPNPPAPRIHRSACTATSSFPCQGLTLDHFKAQLEDLPDTSLTLELNFSTFGPHPRINLGCVGDKVSLR